MKIGQFENKAAVSPALGERKSGAAGGSAGVAPGAEPSAKVELSEAVAALAGGSADGVFDAAKVERISAAIRDGKFTINADAIADKLIANAQDLLGSAVKR
jgi:negative regulator of flagellin synthesis FlgM